MLLISKNTPELSYTDSIATLRLIKTLDLESGQKRLIAKLHKNIIESFSTDLKDQIKSIERTKDIFKVPSGDLHKSLIKIVTQKFGSFDPVFHMQFVINLIKEVNMAESSKMNKQEKELEQEILGYMSAFLQNKHCQELLMKASNNHKIKVIMMLTKFKEHDYISQVVTSEMEQDHQRQRELIHRLQEILIEEFKYERLLPNLISNLSNLKYFLNNAWLTGLKINEEFDKIYIDCASKISHLDLNTLTTLQLNRVIEAAPNQSDAPKFWDFILQIYIDRLKIFVKLEEFKPFDTFSLEVHQKMFSSISFRDEKLKYLQMLMKKFYTERKFMSILQKIDVSNFIIDQSKQHPDILTPESKFLDTLFVNVIKEQTSLYFYKCIDILYVMRLLSQVRFIRSYSEFWYKIEDLFLRMKKDFNIKQIVQIAELYSDMACGS